MGLYDYGARYYASWIGRFVSVDPLQHDYPIYTPYQYAGNQPIIAIDMDGLEPKKVEETEGFKAFSKTEFGNKYLNAYKSGPLKQHDIKFMERPGTKYGDASSFKFIIDGKEYSRNEINEQNINKITNFNSYIYIPPAGASL
ncbi:MAG TPA: RHS repeat-associated core domain-containing protein [Salinivirga sp.]|uniref:RHS repeat domain-containing protein n=1 Tax=Salinivirga sp. TaxID=1970192 RepID=UPI002B47DC11|nr:RHS repeat-associated core domain-containing protein [Salinivirga sp.]HKK59741.1 RHS repeat-associated core domain-containing protein [Salinivirga sp.]